MLVKSILFVDDQPIVLEGLKTLFADNGWRVVDAVTTMDEAMACAKRHAPDCIMTELFAHSRSAFELFRAVKATGMRPPLCIAFSRFGEMEKHVKEVGFAGFIEKGTSAGQLLLEAERLMMGVPAEANRPPRERSGTSVCREERLRGLTFHILLFLAQGKMKKEISDLLGISYSGVDYHIHKLKQMFRVQSREELIYTATKRNMI